MIDSTDNTTAPKRTASGKKRIVPLVEEQEKISKEEESKYCSLHRAYGGVIEATAILDGDVFDISWLPGSKEEIKKALLWLLQNNAELKNPITIVYLLLRKFQPDVGHYVPSLMSLYNQDIRDSFGLDRGTIGGDKCEDLMSYFPKDSEKTLIFAKKWLEVSESHKSLMKKWDPIIKSEKAQLERELIGLGYLPEDYYEQVERGSWISPNGP